MSELSSIFSLIPSDWNISKNIDPDLVVPETGPFETTFTVDPGKESVRFLFPPSGGIENNHAYALNWIHKMKEKGFDVADFRLKTFSRILYGSPLAEEPGRVGNVGTLLGTILSAGEDLKLKAYCDVFSRGENHSIQTVQSLLSSVGFGTSWSKIQSLCIDHGVVVPLVALDLEDSSDARVKVYGDTSHLSAREIFHLISMTNPAYSWPKDSIFKTLSDSELNLPFGHSHSAPRSMLCWSFSGNSQAPAIGLTFYFPTNQVLASTEDLVTFLGSVMKPSSFQNAQRLLDNLLEESKLPNVPFHWVSLKLHTPNEGIGLYCPKEITRKLTS